VFHLKCGAMNNNKIFSIDDLSSLIPKEKSAGKKIVLCHGVFDLLHIGHIRHFNEAKKLGDILIISITPDEFVNKGPNRPAFSIKHRLESLAALQSVDFVVENKWPTAVETIKILKPDIYCKGPDYKNHDEDITGKINEEEKAILSIGGKINYTDDITFSSSNLLNKFGYIFNENQLSLIKKISLKHNYDEIKKMIDELKHLKVLLIGETIIDQYVFCEALGKSGKEPVLVLRDLETQQYAGGAAAIARHLSDFCGSITLLSILGENKEYESFIKDSFSKNIKTKFLYKKGSPTIVKKRYVDKINNNKVLGVYSINDEKLDKENYLQLNETLLKLVPEHDLIIVSDFGHGFISKSTAENISKQKKFTTLNAQINAANVSYHTMENYEEIECIIINENELRHQLRDKDGPLISLMKELSKKQKTSNVVVTQGDDGATLYNKIDDTIHTCPAFASNVIDKIGAGDAMLALFSIALKKGYDKNFSLFIGSLAAAQSVESIGNSKSVSKSKMLKTIQHIIK